MILWSNTRGIWWILRKECVKADIQNQHVGSVNFWASIASLIPLLVEKHLQFKLRPQFKFIFICASEVGSLVWELYNRHQYCRPNEGREECRIAASSATCKSGFSVRRLPGSFWGRKKIGLPVVPAGTAFSLHCLGMTFAFCFTSLRQVPCIVRSAAELVSGPAFKFHFYIFIWPSEIHNSKATYSVWFSSIP